MVVSIVYASNMIDTRKLLWFELENLAANMIANRPWIFLQDFIQVLRQEEHYSPHSLHTDKRMRYFGDYLLHSELLDLSYRGNLFTWWTKNKSIPIAKKLERILVNDKWVTLFSDAFANFGEPNFSDHASTSVVLTTQRNHSSKLLKFTTSFSSTQISMSGLLSTGILQIFLGLQCL